MQAPAYRGALTALSLSFVLHALLLAAMSVWFAGREEKAEPVSRLSVRLMQPSAPEVKPPPEPEPEPATPTRRAPPQAPEAVEPAPEEPAPEESASSPTPPPDARRMTDQAIESIRAYAPPPNADPYAPDLNGTGQVSETIETYRGAGKTFHVRIGKRCFEFDAADDLDSLAPSTVWRFARCPPTD